MTKIWSTANIFYANERLRKKMTLKLFHILLFLILRQSLAFPVDEYFENSLLKALKNDQLAFASDVNIYSKGKIFTANVKEKYSFKLKTGEYSGIEWLKDEDRNASGKVLFIDDLEELYEIDFDEKLCERKEVTDSLIDMIIGSWLPESLFETPKKNVVLGKY